MILQESVTKTILNALNENETYNDIPKATNRTNFEGFDISKVSNGYQEYQTYLDNPGLAKDKGYNEVYIAEMTPQEYIDLCAKYIAKNSETDINILSDEEGMHRHFAKMCHDYATKMKSGNKFPLLILDPMIKEQDGRHRAVAAYINQYDKVPVLISY